MDGATDRDEPFRATIDLRLFPWLRLFRVPTAAADPKRLLLAAVGLLLLRAGWQGLDRALPDPPTVETAGAAAWEWEPAAPSDPGALLGRVAEPALVLVGPFRRLFTVGVGPVGFARAALAALWGVAVWGFIGGAIARIAVVDAARHERVSVRQAVGFASKKALPLIGTPLLPMVGVALVAALVAGFGLLYRVPGGPVAAGALAFLPLLGGLVLALIVIGLAAGWPLMQAAVAAEAEDGFDAMSRSYAYVYQRPWLYAGYVSVAAAVGCVGLVVAQLFAGLVVHLAVWALGIGGPSETVAGLYGQGRGAVLPAAAATHGVWLAAVGLLLRAWVFSAFWTAASVIYLLLRRDVDGKPIVSIAYEAPLSPLLLAAAGMTDRPGPVPAGPHSPTEPAAPSKEPAPSAPEGD